MVKPSSPGEVLSLRLSKASLHSSKERTPSNASRSSSEIFRRLRSLVNGWNSASDRDNWIYKDCNKNLPLNLEFNFLQIKFSRPQVEVQ